MPPAAGFVSWARGPWAGPFALDSVAQMTLRSSTERAEQGQGTLEYVGMIALAVLLVIAIVAAFGKGTSLADIVSGAIGKITGI